MTFPRLVLITDISFLVPGISVSKAACGKIPRTVKRNNLTLDKALLKEKKKGSSTAFEHSEPSLTNSVRNNTSAYKNYLEILLLCPIVRS